MIINHNMSALFANRQVKFNELDLNKDIEKLSTGMRINRAGDDASGLAVSEKLRSQIRGLNQAEQEHRERGVLHPDHRRLPGGDPGHHAPDPRAGCPVGKRHLHR